jgi:peptidoglycan/LPS O-acetylase OafA/YrhL
MWFGKLSYGINIFHQAASGILHGMIRHSTPQIRTLSDAGVTVLALGATLSLASLSYYVFEKRIIRFGHRYRYTPKPYEDALLQTLPVCAQPPKRPW